MISFLLWLLAAFALIGVIELGVWVGGWHLIRRIRQRQGIR